MQTCSAYSCLVREAERERERERERYREREGGQLIRLELLVQHVQHFALGYSCIPGQPVAFRGVTAEKQSGSDWHRSERSARTSAENSSRGRYRVQIYAFPARFLIPPIASKRVGNVIPSAILL